MGGVIHVKDQEMEKIRFLSEQTGGSLAEVVYAGIELLNRDLEKKKDVDGGEKTFQAEEVTGEREALPAEEVDDGNKAFLIEEANDGRKEDDVVENQELLKELKDIKHILYRMIKELCCITLEDVNDPDSGIPLITMYDDKLNHPEKYGGGVY